MSLDEIRSSIEKGMGAGSTHRSAASRHVFHDGWRREVTGVKAGGSSGSGKEGTLRETQSQGVQTDADAHRPTFDEQVGNRFYQLTRQNHQDIQTDEQYPNKAIQTDSEVLPGDREKVERRAQSAADYSHSQIEQEKPPKEDKGVQFDAVSRGHVQTLMSRIKRLQNHVLDGIGMNIKNEEELERFARAYYNSLKSLMELGGQDSGLPLQVGTQPESQQSMPDTTMHPEGPSSSKNYVKKFNESRKAEEAQLGVIHDHFQNACDRLDEETVLNSDYWEKWAASCEQFALDYWGHMGDRIEAQICADKNMPFTLEAEHDAKLKADKRLNSFFKAIYRLKERKDEESFEKLVIRWEIIEETSEEETRELNESHAPRRPTSKL